jgi:hypothetical protein
MARLVGAVLAVESGNEAQRVAPLAGDALMDGALVMPRQEYLARQ